MPKRNDLKQINTLSNEERLILCYDEFNAIYNRLGKDSTQEHLIVWLTGEQAFSNSSSDNQTYSKFGKKSIKAWLVEHTKWVTSGIGVSLILAVFSYYLMFQNDKSNPIPQNEAIIENSTGVINVQDIGGNVDIEVNQLPPAPTATPTPMPERMTGDFNIAIAEFTENTDTGIETTKLSRDISTELFHFMDSQFKPNNAGLVVQVMHQNIGPISGEDGKNGAKQLAEIYNWDLVFYGGISMQNGEVVKVSPRFFARDQPNTQRIRGQFEFAYPIQIEAFHKTEALRERAEVLTAFTQGLVLLSSEEAGYLDKASTFFRKAVSASQQLASFKGQEIIYYFYAHTKLRLDDYEEALDFAQQARDINISNSSSNPGVHTVLGQIYYKQAIQSTPYDDGLLDQALAEYKLAERSDNFQEDLYTREKIKLLEAHIYWAKALMSKDYKLAIQAINLYSEIVDFYENQANSNQQNNTNLKRNVADAFWGLGLINQSIGNGYLELNQTNKAQDHYLKAQNFLSQCVILAPEKTRKADCEKNSNEISVLDDNQNKEE